MNLGLECSDWTLQDRGLAFKAKGIVENEES